MKSLAKLVDYKYGNRCNIKLKYQISRPMIHNILTYSITKNKLEKFTDIIFQKKTLKTVYTERNIL